MRRAVLLAALGALPACSGREGTVVEVRPAALSATSVTITLSTPRNVGATSVALAANGSLIVNAATTVTGAGTGSTTANSIVTNVGAAGTRVEPDAQLKGDVWSASTLTLKDRVHVYGVTHVTTAPVRGTGVLTDGGVDTTTPLVPATTLQWTAALPASGPAISVSPGQSASRGPGAYAAVQLFQNATLTLSTGTYYFDSLQLESGSHVVLSQTSGPVIIYVRATAALRGDFKASVSGAAPDLLLVYLGSTDLAAEVPFSGTIVAPNARLFLGSVTPGHTGAFFAKTLEVGPHTKVTFRAPHVLLVAGHVPNDSCLASIVADPTLTGKARELQFQADILRYCTGAEMGPCERTVVARLNVDFFNSASQLMLETISPAKYLAVVQDRHRKLKSFRGNESLACAVAQGDTDGDFVPNAQDVCPTTPDLTPTLANGCTDTTLPPAPTAADLRPLFSGGIAVAVDPRCVGAPTPMVPAPLGAWRFPPDPTQGKAIWVSRDGGTSGCPIWYEVEVELTDGLGIRDVIVSPSEDTTVPWITRPAGAVQFHLTTSDPGDRGAWASYAVYTKQYRARAVNGGGRRSPWSDWFSPGHEDCLAGLCPDGRTP